VRGDLHDEHHDDRDDDDDVHDVTMDGPQQPQPQIVIPGQGWVDVAARIIVQLGFPTVIAGVLLWFVLVRVDGTLKMIQEQEDTRTKLTLAMQDKLIVALDQLGARFDQAIDANIRANRDLAAKYEQSHPR